MDLSHEYSNEEKDVSEIKKWPLVSCQHEQGYFFLILMHEAVEGSTGSYWLS